MDSSVSARRIHLLLPVVGGGAEGGAAAVLPWEGRCMDTVCLLGVGHTWVTSSSFRYAVYSPSVAAPAYSFLSGLRPRGSLQIALSGSVLLNPIIGRCGTLGVVGKWYALATTDLGSNWEVFPLRNLASTPGCVRTRKVLVLMAFVVFSTLVACSTSAALSECIRAAKTLDCRMLSSSKSRSQET